MILKFLKLINFLTNYFFNFKFLRFNQHLNGTCVIKYHDKYLKVSFSKYGKYLINNEIKGYNWYLKKIKLIEKLKFKKTFLFSQIKTDQFRGVKKSYENSIITNSNFILLAFKHYENVWEKKNKVLFDSKFEYYGTDLIDRSIKTKKSFVIGDICDSEYLKKNKKFINFFDVIYSNNVFEHLHNPFIAMENIYKMLKVDGYLITVVPFAARYHQSPGDYFRYTHQGLEKIISDAGQYKTLITGYDISKRRFNIQGKKIQDIVPLDSFGGWRENWDVINISMKIK